MTTPVSWYAAPEVAVARRRTLGLLSAAQILGGIGSGAGLSVGILLAERVTNSEGWAGLARSGTTIGAALFAIPLAAIAVRSGRRVSLGGGWLAAAAGSLLLVVAAERIGSMLATVLLIFGMVLAGCGSAVTLQSRYAATDLAAPNRRSRDLSLVVWSTTVGSVLGPNLGAPGQALSDWLGMQPFAGPFIIATVMQLVAAGLFLFLRPDPLLLASRLQGLEHPIVMPNAALPGRRLNEALRMAWRVPAARVALVSMCCAHTVMVGVMTMTPVDMEHHGATVTLVGLTISLHVLGMFGLSPLVGWLSDRFGRVRTIAAGSVTLLVATAVAGTAGMSGGLVMVGLFLLGFGWSLSMVAASALLTESVAPQVRTRVQGTADAAINACAAIGADISGPLLGVIGFGGLNALAAAIVVAGAPFVIAALRRSTAKVGLAQ